MGSAGKTLTRLAAICFGVLLLCVALIAWIVFSQRRVFPAREQIVVEIGSQNRGLYAIEPNSSFGGRFRLLFDPERSFSDRYVTGIDCSPDNRSLIFWYIYLYRYDLAAETLTRLRYGEGLSQMSVWSPDGSHIAYSDDIADRQPREIFVIDADGTHKTQITSNADKETSLSWSPDGRRVAYTYSFTADPAQQGLAVVDVASGAVTPLYQAAARINDAAWSPDGTEIAFDMSAGNRVGDRIDIYTVPANANGSALKRLTSGGAQNVIPRWSPDGTMISFSSREAAGHYQLYVMDADGSNPYLVFNGLPDEDIYNRCWLIEPMAGA